VFHAWRDDPRDDCRSIEKAYRFPGVTRDDKALFKRQSRRRVSLSLSRGLLSVAGSSPNRFPRALARQCVHLRRQRPFNDRWSANDLNVSLSSRGERSVSLSTLDTFVGRARRFNTPYTRHEQLIAEAAAIISYPRGSRKYHGAPRDRKKRDSIGRTTRLARLGRVKRPPREQRGERGRRAGPRQLGSRAHNVAGIIGGP